MVTRVSLYEIDGQVEDETLHFYFNSRMKIQQAISVFSLRLVIHRTIKQSLCAKRIPVLMVGSADIFQALLTSRLFGSLNRYPQESPGGKKLQRTNPNWAHCRR
ncbi:hypothetical protein RRG08_049930 [Elysia crispata]|uniref:Uncharacterized protein n=1 Tax=Elysia crispata TaxID=231223 RepID=A0AAE0XZE6_9GAST|nr:hypothetical protein RRG08_049930 [Elysia crispata]